MHEGRVLYAGHDHVHVLRYEGDVRFPLAPSVSGFVDELLNREPSGELIFDFSEAEAIDSTNLGAIARIADRISLQSGKRAAIISPRPEISRVLFSMAFDEVFDIHTEPASVPAGEPIPELPASQDVAAQTILSAHQRLMEMSESNREQFREVVELMQGELNGKS